MNILQRKMFQGGDEVTNLDTSQLSTSEAYQLIKELGIDPTDKSEIEIMAEVDAIYNDLSSPKAFGKYGYLFDYTDPLDYVALGAGALTLGSAGAVVKGGNLANKGRKVYLMMNKLKRLKKFLNPATLKPGIAIAGKKGFQSRNRLNPLSYTYDPKKTGAYALAGFGADAFLDYDQKPTRALPQNIQDALNQIGTDQSTTVEGAGENGSEELSQQSIDYNNLIKLYNEAADQSDIDYQNKQSSFDKQNIYLEEISSALAESGGDFGYGLSTGAAKASKRLSAEELADAEAMAKLIQDKKDGDKLKETTVGDILEKYGTRTNELAGTNYLRGELKTLVSAIDPSQSDSAWTTGLRGWSQRFGDEFEGFIGTDVSLSKASTAANIASYLEANLVQDLLQESGRTISDRDRILIKEILGDLTKITSNRADILNALRKVDAALQRSARAQANDVLALRTRYGSRIPEFAIYDRDINMESIVPSVNQSSDNSFDGVSINKSDVIEVTN